MHVLITGGASGLGEAITRELAGNSEHHIFFTYCHSEKNAREIEKRFLNTTAIHCDFADKDEMAVLLDRMETMELDVLVNNATTRIALKHFHEMAPESFLERFKENIFPVIAITKQAIGIFRKRNSGRIVTVLTSYLSENPPIGLSAYVAEKAYLASLSRSWAVENARFHIISNTLSPSFMSTGLTRDVDQRLLVNEKARELDPKEVARALAAFLRGEETGETFDSRIKFA